MKKIIFSWSIFLFCIVFGLAKVQAQINLLPANSNVYRKYGIKKIEKVMVGDTTIGQHDFISSVEELNTIGFPIKYTIYDQNGITGIQSFTYLNDSILVENHMQYFNSNNLPPKITKYTYNKANKMKTMGYYDGTRLITDFKFKYSKNGLLHSQWQNQYNDKQVGSYRTIKSHFTHNNDGKLVEIYSISKDNKKTDKKHYVYVYSDQYKMEEEYLVMKNRNKITNRLIYDDNGRLKEKEHFSSTGSIYNYDNRQLKVKQGEVLCNEYFYDDRGLVVLEKISTADGQEINYLYRYYDYE